ncbi:hypothetical protein VCHA43P282_90122 [Vibrio chagasii]|nr:hypothetical protein VCHA43P282_90122 [Vibrio chagasii]
MKKPSMRILSYTVIMLMLGGCNSSDSDNMTSLYDLELKAYTDGVINESPEMPVGIPQQFVAVGFYDDGTSKDVTESISWLIDDSIHSADNGLLTGSTVGSYDVVAHLNDIDSNSVKFIIKDAVIQNIETSLGSVEIVKGKYANTQAVGYFSDGSAHNITNYVNWGSSDPDVAFVSKNIALGLKKGVSEITSSYSGIISDPKSLEVIALDKLSILAKSPKDNDEDSSNQIVEGTSTILLVNGEYSNGTVEQLTNQVEWESSDLSVLSVNKNGHLLALSPGTVTLTATKDDVTSEPVEIDVVQAAAVKVEINTVTPEKLHVGSLIAFEGNVTYDNGMINENASEIIWDSIDPSLEQIGSSGVFRATKTTDSVQVLATVADISEYSNPIKIVDSPLEKVEFRTSNGGAAIVSASVKRTESEYVSVWGQYEGSSEYVNISSIGDWTSTSPLITVYKGLITVSKDAPLGVNDTISFKIDGEVEPSPLSINVVSAPITSVKIERTEKLGISDLFPTETLSLSLRRFRADGTNTLSLENVSWTTSSESLATVDSGLVKANFDKGIVTITATTLGFSDSLEIPINKVPHCGGSENTHVNDNADYDQDCVDIISDDDRKYISLYNVRSRSLMQRLGYHLSYTPIGRTYQSSSYSVFSFTGLEHMMWVCNDVNNWYSNDGWEIPAEHSSNSIMTSVLNLDSGNQYGWFVTSYINAIFAFDKSNLHIGKRGMDSSDQFYSTPSTENSRFALLCSYEK